MVLCILIIIFGILSIFAAVMPVTILDLPISREIQEHNNALFDLFMKFVSWFGTVPVSIIMVITTVFLFFICGCRRESYFIVLTLSSGIISSVLKSLFNRPRLAADLVRVIENTHQQSFPSGHTLFYTVFFGLLIIIMIYKENISKYIRISIVLYAALMIFLVPQSRVYLGAHWFSDVLAGFVLGIIWLFIIGFFYLKKQQK